MKLNNSRIIKIIIFILTMCFAGHKVLSSNCPDGAPEVVPGDSFQSMTIVHLSGTSYRYDFEGNYDFQKKCIGGGCVRSLFGRVKIVSVYNTQYIEGNSFSADPPFCDVDQIKTLTISGINTISGSPASAELISWGYAH